MEDKRFYELADKYFFAAYINMARHNAYLVVADINNKVLGSSISDDDAKISSAPIFKKLKPAPNETVPPDLQLKIMKELQQHFPFLKTMLFAFKKPKGNPSEEEVQKMEYAPSDYHDFFAVFFKTLNDLRNEYTHVVPQPFNFPESLLHGLRITFDAAVRKAKSRFNFEPKQMEHLVRQGKGGKERPASVFKYKFKNEQDNQLTITGLTFFICMLLERKYASLFTQKLRGYKDRRVRAFQATYEVFAIHCLTLPKARYTSDIAEGALLLDMLNELKRCPDELFAHLGDKDQDAFRIPISEATADEESENGFVLLKRHEDRFPYFTLRFLDEVKWFNKLRFPVDLGNYNYFLYPKTVDGMARVGSLWEKMIGYGRLPDYQRDYVEKKLPQSWQQLHQNHSDRELDEEIPYMPPTMPHYHLQDDNVAIRIVDEPVSIWPDIVTVDNVKTNKPAKKYQPDILMSHYELFGMLFYGLLLDTGRIKELEYGLIQYVSKRRQLYRKIADGEIKPLSVKANVPKPNEDGVKHPLYDKRKEELNKLFAEKGYAINCDELPDEVKCYLMGVETESFEIKAKFLIKDFIIETEDRIDRINEQIHEKRKPGSRKDVEIKAGVLADFLAKDIMLFQPPVKDPEAKANNKATTTLFKVLQAKLALYGAHVDTLERTFNECGLLTGNNPHPFLARVVQQQKKNIVDFYRAYLKARLQYLERCEEEKKYTTYHWVKNNQARRKSQTDYGTQLAKNMLEHPIVVPRGYFTQLIKTELKRLNDSVLNEAIDNAREPNNSYMLVAYLKHHLKDDVQEFYNWERIYKIFNNYFDPNPRRGVATKLKPLNEPQRKELFNEVKKWAVSKSRNSETNYEHRFRDFEANEKKLRHVKMEDIVTFLACNYLLKNINKNLLNVEGQFYLRDISPNADKGVLDKPMDRFGRDFSFYCENKTGTLTESIKGTTRIYQDELKVKNIGDFNRFSKDRRLNNLLAYIQKPQISRTELEAELERYDKVRVEIFQVIHEFETRMKEHVPENDAKDFGNIMVKYQQLTGTDGLTGEQVQKIRNAFSHNQYPDPIYFTHLLEISDEKQRPRFYADYFLAFLKEKLQ